MTRFSVRHHAGDEQAAVERALRAASSSREVDPDADRRAKAILDAVRSLPPASVRPHLWPWLLPAVALPVLALALWLVPLRPPGEPAAGTPRLEGAGGLEAVATAPVAVAWFPADLLVMERDHLAADTREAVARIWRTLPL